jgi:sugar lactone lactonase YvrE
MRIIIQTLLVVTAHLLFIASAYSTGTISRSRFSANTSTIDTTTNNYNRTTNALPESLASAFNSPYKQTSHTFISTESISLTYLNMKHITGTATPGYSGDGNQATSAQIQSLFFWVDPNGNIYLADTGNYRIRKITASSGIISSFGGTGSFSISGAAGPIGSVGFSTLHGIVGDATGNFLYFSDNSYIWKHSFSTGIVSVLAGVSSTGFGGDNGPATSAQLNGPFGVWLTTGNDFYIADCFNHRIRKVSSSSNIISTVTGSGGAGSYGGDSGPGTSAALYSPTGVYVDTTGKMFIADSGNNRIRVVSSSGIITTFAGPGSGSFTPDGAQATSTNIGQLKDLKGDSVGNIYYSDYGNNLIRLIDTSGIVTTVFGTGSSGFSSGVVPRLSTINRPWGIWLDSLSAIYFSDENSIHRGIDVLTPTSQPSQQPTTQPTRQPSRLPSTQPTKQPISRPSGQPSRQPSSHPTMSHASLNYLNMKHIAGSASQGFSGDNGQATSAQIRSTYIWVDPSSGNIYLADGSNYRIRKITASTGIISTFGGTGTSSTAGTNGPIGTVSFSAVGGIVGDSASSSLYFTDATYIWKHSFATGIVSVIAGTSTTGFAGDSGPATSAQLNTPYGLWLTTGGDLYIADRDNNRIRKITSSTSIISTVAGTGGPGSYSGDNVQATSTTLNSPSGVYLDTTGKMFIADSTNRRIRVVSTSGIITTFAGVGSGSFIPDGAQATSTTLGQLKDLKGDSAGNIYYSDSGNGVIRMIDASGIVITVFGIAGFTGFKSGVVPRLSTINSPSGIWLDSLSTIYLSDQNSIHRSVDGTPTSQPSRQPARQPSNQPTCLPTGQPSRQPSSHPTMSLTYLNLKQIAGTAVGGYSGDSGQATSAQIQATFFWVDPNGGNIYIADSFNYRIRKITASTGIISTFGGTGTSSSSGLGGPIGSVSFRTLGGIVGDATGNFLYFSDTSRIWKYTFSTGIVSIIAGTDTAGFSGDQGPAGSAQLNNPFGIWLSIVNDLYIADYANNRIRKISSSTGIITTVAGSGASGALGSFSGDTGQATTATLNYPFGVYVDTNGKIFIVDYGNNRIRVVSSSGIISTYAGTGSTSLTADGLQATSTNLHQPHDVKGDYAGNIYYSDTHHSIVRMIDTSGIVTTVFGTAAGPGGFSSGIVDRLSANNGPLGLWLDSLSTIYFSDGNSIHSGVDGTPTSQPSSNPTMCLTYVDMKLVAGTANTGYSGDKGPATSAQIKSKSLWVHPNNGDIYFADASNFRIRKVTGSNGIISTFAGTGLQSSNGTTGPIGSVSFGRLGGIVGDTAGNTLFFSDDSFVWKYNFTSGIAAVIAGTVSTGFAGDLGPAIAAQLDFPYNLWLTTGNDLYIADQCNNRIRKITSTGIITTVAGSGAIGCGTGGYSGDFDQARNAQLNSPYGVYMDTVGKIFIADLSNFRIRVVSASGIITTYAGTGIDVPFTQDSAQATSTNINEPTDVKGDSVGNIYYSDYNYCIIRMIARSGIVTTIFGTAGSPGFSGGLVPRLSAINNPSGIWLDSRATMYFSDENSIHRSVDDTPTSQPSRQPTRQPSNQPTCLPTGQPSRQPSSNPTMSLTYLNMKHIAGTGTSGFNGDGGPATSAQIQSRHFWVDPNHGNIYLADTTSYRIRKIAASTGIISTFGGTGTNSNAGTAGPIETVSFSALGGIVGDTDGNSLYFSDFTHIWKHSFTTGIVSVIAGTSTAGFTGDNGPATSAQLNDPLGVWLTTGGDLYFADGSNHRIRKISSSGNIISTVAGVDTTGNTNGPASSAKFNYPNGVYMDTTGRLFIADYTNRKIRALSTSAIVSDYAGTGSGLPFTADGAQATSTNMNQLRDVKGDSAGNIYYAESFVFRFRMIATSGIVTTLFGTGSPGFTPGVVPRLSGAISSPAGIWLDSLSNIYFSDLRSIHLGVDGTPTAQPSQQPTGLPTRQPSSNPTMSLTYLNMRHVVGSASAGSLITGYGGDNGPATSAKIQSKSFWVHPNSGDIYLADDMNFKIRKVTSSTGIISTFGGSGAQSANGTAGPIESVSFGRLGGGIVGDTAGNFLYFSDYSHIWKYNFTSGVAAVIAGTSSFGFGGDRSPAISAQVDYPQSIWLTTEIDLYIADSGNNRIRKITSSTSIITTVAGNGPLGSYSGDNVKATSTALNYPTGVYIDTTGKMFIADYFNNRIRVVSTSGIITTFAGTGSFSFTSDGAQATSTNINNPVDVKGDSAGNIYYSDSGNYIIRMIARNGIVTTIFGSGSPGFSSGVVPRLSAIKAPCGIWLDSLSTIYFSDENSIHCSVDGTPTSQPSQQPSSNPTMSLTYVNMKLVAGSASTGYSGDNSPATSAMIQSKSLWVNPNNGNIFLADGDNFRIRKVNGSTGIISTFGGIGLLSSNGTAGPIASVGFSRLAGIVGDTAGNTLYFADDSHIWKYSFVSGIASVLAGTSTAGFSGDRGPPASAQVSFPQSLWLTTGNDLYIADSNNNRIRLISAGIITTVAGSGIDIYSGDNIQATSAGLNFPTGVYVDTTGRMFIADSENNRIHVVSSSGIITTFAGTGSHTFTQDGAQATSTNINYPTAVKGDSVGNIYYSEYNNYIIRMIARSGIVSTVFGTVGSQGFSSGVVPRLSRIYGPCGIWLDSLSTIYFSDENSIHRSVDGTPTSQPSQQPTTQPTRQPIRLPSSQPTSKPSNQPSGLPSCQPTSQPTRQPSSCPSNQPSRKPSNQPTRRPSSQPSSLPTGQPSSQPTGLPTSQPSMQPFSRPSSQPSVQPSGQPSSRPSVQPSMWPSTQPTMKPSSQPSSCPTNQPSSRPSSQPSSRPSTQPSSFPTTQPTVQPSFRPSSQPSRRPTNQPTSQPSALPSSQPSQQPSSRPTSVPSRQPSSQPTVQPSTQPSRIPTSQPSRSPSTQPTTQPTTVPTMQPTSVPSSQPSSLPSSLPTTQPSGQPTGQPSGQPAGVPTSQPSSIPSCQPSSEPTNPTSQPTIQPSSQPTHRPSTQPTRRPSMQPSSQPSSRPSRQPSTQPSGQPSRQPSSRPSAQPSSRPSTVSVSIHICLYFVSYSLCYFPSLIQHRSQPLVQQRYLTN